MLSLLLATAISLFVTACGKNSERAPDPESLLRMKAQCAEAGAKMRQEWMAKYPGERFLGDPEFRYSPSLNTCLYADEYADWNDDGKSVVHNLVGAKERRDRFVMDVYSGKMLVEYTEHDGASITMSEDPVMCRTEAEFEARKAALLGQTIGQPGEFKAR